MKGSLAKYRRNILVALILLLIIQIPLAFYTSSSDHYYQSNREVLNTIRFHTIEIELEGTRLLEALNYYCSNDPDACRSTQIAVQDLADSPKLGEIQVVAGNAGEWFHKRHEEQIHRVIIALRSVSVDSSIMNQERVTQSFQTLNEIHAQIERDIERESQIAYEQQLVVNLLLAIVSIALLILYIMGVRISHTSAAAKSDDKWAQVIEVSQALGNYDQVNLIDSAKKYDPAVQSIVERFLSNQSRLASAKDEIELFRRINNSINYEFRTLTNTITGGLKLLSGDLEGKSIVLANEMMQSTNVLDELANNFLSVFGDASEESEANVGEIIDKVVSLIRTKTERNNQQLECFVSRYVPETIQVSPIKLLWSIYLELSKAIDLYRHKSIAIVVDADRIKGSVQRQLSINFYFLDDLSLSLDEIQNIQWTDREVQSNCFADVILGADVDSELSINTCSKQVVYSLSIVVRPSSTFRDGSLLKDKRFVVCGSLGLQTDIIQRTIEIAGGEVIILKSPGEIFKGVAKVSNCSAIIVTDTVKGLEFQSFLKTLQSRISMAKVSTKVILSLTSQEFDIDSTQFVDRVVLRPISPSNFVESVTSILEDDASETDNQANQIVCIDDDATHGFILTEILQESNWDAIHFESANEGIEYVKNNDIRVVFMDCIMPDIDGFEATRIIRDFERESTKGNHLTIIGATGLTSVSEMTQCIEAGMDYVINKPYSQEEIIRVLKTYTAAKKVS